METATFQTIKDNFPELVEGQTTEAWIRAYLEIVHKADPGLEADFMEVCQEVASSEEEEKEEIDAAGLDELEGSPEKDRIEVIARITALLRKFMREAFSILETAEKKVADLEASDKEKKPGQLKSQATQETKEAMSENPVGHLQQDDVSPSHSATFEESQDSENLEDLNSTITKMKVITEQMPAYGPRIQWVCILGEGTDVPDQEYYPYKPLIAYQLKSEIAFRKIYFTSDPPPANSEIFKLEELEEIHRCRNYPNWSALDKKSIITTDIYLESEDLKQIQEESKDKTEYLVCELGTRVIVDFKETPKSAYVGLIDRYYCI